MAPYLQSDKTLIKVKGDKEIASKLRQITKETPKALDEAIGEEAHLLQRESLMEVPVDKGVLRGSGFVLRIREFLWHVGYDTDYAVFVHEDLNARHTAPTKAKFLEDPFKRRSKGYFERLARRVKRKLRL